MRAFRNCYCRQPAPFRVSGQSDAQGLATAPEKRGIDRGAVLTTIGASISAVAVAAWTVLVWFVAEGPKYIPLLTLTLGETSLRDDGSGSCQLYL